MFAMYVFSSLLVIKVKTWNLETVATDTFRAPDDWLWHIVKVFRISGNAFRALSYKNLILLSTRLIL